MKNFCKKAIVIILALTVMMTLCVPAFADVTGKKQYKSYCAIGDSIATGYGPLDGWGWESHYFTVCDKAYPGLVRDELGAEYHSLTSVATRLVDYMWILDVAGFKYNYDESVSYHGKSYVYYLQTMKGERACNCIRNSELVTIALGNMDVFIFPRNKAAEGGFDVAKFIQYATEGLESFVFNYPKLIQRIKELNPDIEIMVLAQYNPFENLNYTGVLGKTLMSGMAVIVDQLNAELKLMAAKYGCIYVDDTNVGSTFKRYDVPDSDLIGVLGGHENHPDAIGHQMIAEDILKALPDAWKSVLLPACGMNRVLFGGQGEADLNFRNVGLTSWTVRTSDGSFVNFDKELGDFSYGDKASTLWHYNGGLYTDNLVKKTIGANCGFSFSYYMVQRAYMNVDAGTLVPSSCRVSADFYVSN